VKSKVVLGCGVAMAALLAGSSLAEANDELLLLQQNPAFWVMQGGNYSHHRYSQLAQIN